MFRKHVRRHVVQAVHQALEVLLRVVVQLLLCRALCSTLSVVPVAIDHLFPCIQPPVLPALRTPKRKRNHQRVNTSPFACGVLSAGVTPVTLGGVTYIQRAASVQKVQGGMSIEEEGQMLPNEKSTAYLRCTVKVYPF